MKREFNSKTWTELRQNVPLGWRLVAVTNLTGHFLCWKEISGDSIPPEGLRYFHECKFVDYIRDGICPVCGSN